MTYDKIPMKDLYRLILDQSFLAGLEDVAGDANIVGAEKAEEAKKFINSLNAEFAQGVSVDMPYQCVVGRRTLDGRSITG